MIGLDRNTFQPIDDRSRLWDAAREAIRTQKGSRVLRRNLGTNIIHYVDRSNTPATRAIIIAETTSALAVMVPELRIKRVNFTQGERSIALQITTEANESITV